jgi:bifunctional DNA-binding transcriptional regulator/antitoxin component of YhaV-PrlF toxin-antitoxin module
VRKRLGIGPGDEVEFWEENGRYVLTKKMRRSPFEEYRGFLRELKGCDPDQIIRELRGE